MGWIKGLRMCANERMRICGVWGKEQGTGLPSRILNPLRLEVCHVLSTHEATKHGRIKHGRLPSCGIETRYVCSLGGALLMVLVSVLSAVILGYPRGGM